MMKPTLHHGYRTLGTLLRIGALGALLGMIPSVASAQSQAAEADGSPPQAPNAPVLVISSSVEVSGREAGFEIETVDGRRLDVAFRGGDILMDGDDPRDVRIRGSDGPSLAEPVG